MRGITIVLSFVILIVLTVSSSAIGGEKHEFIIIDKVASAPVQSQPNGSDPIGRFEAGSKVEIFGKKTVRSGPLAVIWYRVKINGKNGWISQYVTMGDVITEDVDTGLKETKRELGADKVRMAKFNEEAKRIFKEWAINDTAVTWLEYQANGIIWVRLSPSKYTSKVNVQKIADHLARVYRLQTNYNKTIVVTIWDPYQAKMWAKGRLP